MKNRVLDNRLWWVPGLGVLSCLVLSYWPTIQVLARQWIANEDYSHGLLIVPISAYLIWEKRNVLKTLDAGSDWRALPLLIFSILVFIVGELGAELFTTRVSMLIFVIASVWLLYGIQVVQVLRFPLAFLFLMLPLPGFIYRNLTFPLQIFSSTWAVKLLQLLGISSYREGNVIDMGFTQFQVVEACNGLRFILPLFTLGVLFAFLGQRSIWKRSVLILATIPIAIIANVIRIAGTGVAATHWGSRVADGFYHSFSGWAVFMFCFVLFAALHFLLKLMPGGRGGKNPTPPASEDPGRVKRKITWVPMVIAMAFILATPLVVDYLGRVPPRALEKPLQTFPVKFNGWSGRMSKMDDKIWERVGGQEYVVIDYFRNDRNPVNFYTAFYEYQRKAGDFIHSPKLCLPGSGWFIEKNGVRNLPYPENGDRTSEGLKFNELVMNKNDVRQLAYYWYQGRGRNFTNEFAAKFYMVWDGVWRRRTDGALVRLIMPLGRNETLQDARRTLDPFAVEVAQELEKYLP